MEEKKRYNLGVLIGGVHTYFPKEHIKGISEAAAELDVNVCFFLGTRTKDFFEDVLGSKQKNSYDYQFNTIHDYSLIGGLDGLIINYGTLGIQLREVDPNEFARKYNGITTVFLTEVVDVPNCHFLIWWKSIICPESCSWQDRSITQMPLSARKLIWKP